ncbi:DNA-binding response regulator, OmpR family, contains REC and winged-helix (wHTH) domain [Novosphingobium sp. B1]|nr:DNA-binding response regulator, OmpR family, contains REC and winged-helix (wHTH) domain [Novosphingobium sp. B1]
MRGRKGDAGHPGGCWTMSNLNILYVEDDPRAAEAVQALVLADGDRLAWEQTGTGGLHRAGAEAFDVIILDRMLPDLDGLTIVSRLRAAGVGTPVLMLSALGRSENRIEGLEAGVDDYLAKPYEPQELVARLRALHRRSAGAVHGAVIIYGAFECHTKARTAFRSGRHVPLSPREFALFRYFMENAGETVTREMLLRDVWNMNFDPQTNVVDVNIGRLRRKLEDGFASPALETIWGAGYRLTRGE